MYNGVQAKAYQLTENTMIATTDKPLGETKVDQTLIVDHEVYTAKVQTAKIDQDFPSRFTDDGDEIADLIDGLVAPDNVYPHTMNPGQAFDPYLATYVTREFCFVDEDYLLRNLHERRTLDMSGIKWKPQEIPDYNTQPRANFDIETTGLDPHSCEVTMVGVKLRGEFGSAIIPRYKKLFDYAHNGGLIFTYNLPGHAEPGEGLVIEKMMTSIPDGKKFKQIEKTYAVKYCKDEADMLAQMWHFMDSLKVVLVSLHNGYEFDCPMLTVRSKLLNISCPWTTVLTTDRRTGEIKKKMNTAASMNGKPMEFFPTYWAKPNSKGMIWNDGGFPQIIDTMHLAGQHDKLAGDMLGYGLKYIAADYLKGRDGHRTELSYNQMLEAWNGGDPAKLKTYREYLIYDLEDQDITSEFFMANIWSQQKFMPLPLQEICVASPARKWNAILTQVYKPIEGTRVTRKYNGVATTITIQKPQMDEKVKMEGGISRVSPGMYRNFYKVDVASLYPSIMLRWLLADLKKDPLGILLYILIQARTLRYHYKALGNKTNNKQLKKTYKAIDAALKVLLNGSFGFCGAGGYGYNSMRTAALITAYGRIMLRIMMHVASRYHRIIEADTDGLYIEVKLFSGEPDSECVKFTQDLIGKLSAKANKLQTAFGMLTDDAPNREDAEKDLDKAKKAVTRQINCLAEMLDVGRCDRMIHTPEFVHHKMQEVLPYGSDAPDASDIGKVGIVLDLEENCPDGIIYAPKAKNYIKFKSEDAEPSVKGIYRKRNRTPLQKEHLIKYIKIRAFKGEVESNLYINAVLNAIRDLSVSLAAAAGQTVAPSAQLDSGDYKVELTLKDVTTTQRIPSNGKWLTECNMGEPGGSDKVSFYWGHLSKRGKATKAFPDGRPIKGKEFPIRVIIGDDWTHTVMPQHIPDTFNRADIAFTLDLDRYEGNFLKSVADIDGVIAQGESRTSMTIDDEDLKLPAWYIEELDTPF